MRFRGLPADRDVLRTMGHELRLKHGSDVLSQRVLDRLAFELRQGVQRAITVIDAIRNPAEVRLLRASLGDDFTLAAIEASVDLIIARLRARARQGDVLDDDDLARRVLEAEMGLDEPEHGHNIAECIAMADIQIDNRDGLDDLRARVRAFVDALVVPTL